MTDNATRFVFRIRAADMQLSGITSGLPVGSRRAKWAGRLHCNGSDCSAPPLLHLQ